MPAKIKYTHWLECLYCCKFIKPVDRDIHERYHLTFGQSGEEGITKEELNDINFREKYDKKGRPPA